MNQRPAWRTAVVVTIGLAIAVLLLGGTAAYLYFNAAQMEANRHQSIVIGRRIAATLSLREAVDTLDSTERSYVLTNDAAYLEPYNAALSAMPQRLAQLVALLGDDPAQASRLTALQTSVEKKVSNAKKTLAVFVSSGVAGAAASLGDQADLALLTEIRTTIDAIIASENAILNDRFARADQAERRNEVIALLVVGGTILILAISAGALFSAFQRRDRSQSVLQATINSIARGIAAFERDRLVAWNDRFVSLLDIPAELAKTGTPIARFETGILGDLTRQMEQSRKKNETIVIERTTADGRIFALYFSPPKDGIATFGAADVTLDRQRDRFLQHAQKMDALGKMTGGIAHDFNNLLTVVLMNLDVLKDDPATMQRFGRRIELMSAASQKGSTLVKQLLAYARKQPLEPEVVDLRELMPSLLDLVRRTIGEDIETECRSCEGTCTTIVDPAQFESSVLNLALNARDAMPDGGTLRLELSRTTIDARSADTSPDIGPGEYVLLTVVDSGCGMTPEVMARAFDPFFTTKADGRGTGLGLSMVYGFVKQTGGHIAIASIPGSGTAFKLYFPLCHADTEETGPPVPEIPPKGTGTVLIVEDDDRLRTTAASALRDLGYDSLQAANSQSALTLLESDTPVDVLFTDMILSGPVNGEKLAAAARVLRPGIKVLYTSGYIEKAERQRDSVDPAVGLLNKPYQIGDLAFKLRDLLAQPVG